MITREWCLLQHVIEYGCKLWMFQFYEGCGSANACGPAQKMLADLVMLNVASAAKVTQLKDPNTSLMLKL
jgi:hypothetical protein